MLDSSPRGFHCRRELVYETAKKVQAEMGDVDCLINNAGILGGANLMDIPDGKIVKIFEVNVLCHFWTVRFVPHPAAPWIFVVVAVAGQGVPACDAQEERGPHRLGRVNGRLDRCPAHDRVFVCPRTATPTVIPAIHTQALQSPYCVFFSITKAL